MGCRTDGYAEADLRASVDALTRLLCAVCREKFDNVPMPRDLLSELSAWHVAHTETDRARARRIALAKLTAEDIKALGLEIEAPVRGFRG